MDEMKRRWSPLFWASLTTLIGVAWLAVRLSIPLSSLMGVWLVGMIAACGVALFAMVKRVRHKWPAAVALACAGPMAIDMKDAVFNLPSLIIYVGLSFAVLVLGMIATVIVAIVILVKPLPPPPRPDPIAPARVVD